MLNLIFFTTNRIKLAHARCMAEGYPVAIESFRRKTFYASYTEPNIESRDELLQQSYESALEQAENAGINVDKRFFFLEDTSVVVDALSTRGREVPGVTVKYWMQGMTFENLDMHLRPSGNRNTSVRSDILLHIPAHYRQKWRINSPYIVFVGVQHGTVVQVEQPVTTNLVFPWLDSKTFNKWFVPKGAALPLSCLPIEEANQYDFRRHAFLQMMEFLTEKGVLQPTYEQRSFNLSACLDGKAKIIIICGFPCAGKTTLAQHLVRSFGYLHLEASDFMYLNFYLRHGVDSGITIADFAEEALKQKPEIAAEKIADYMEDTVGQSIVISGFRSREEIDWLIDRLGEKWQELPIILCFVEANQSIRFKRCIERKRDGHEIAIERFRQRDRQQARMGMAEIESSEDFEVIKNESTLEDFFANSDAVLVPRQPVLPSRDIDFSIFHELSRNIGLEAPILMALLSRWADMEDRDYFTTTAIAKLINELFPSMRPKHKDNVSRYFNQDFYAFYEIKWDLDEHKRKYRLSNTGYGKAVFVYHELSSSLLSIARN